MIEVCILCFFVDNVFDYLEYSLLYQSRLRQLPQHVVQNATMFEVLDFNISIQPHSHIKCFATASLHLYVFSNFEISAFQVDSISLSFT